MEEFEPVQVIASPKDDVVDFIQNEVEPQKAEPYYYTIVAPTRFRANSTYNVTLTVHSNPSETVEIAEAIVVRVSIEDENNEKENAYKIYRDIEMKLDATENVLLDIGDVSDKNHYKLVARGISGITIEREAGIDLQTQIHSILIQTDKAIYKPSDKILFRVLVLDSELKPAASANGALEISFTVSVMTDD